jgi:hypothetical protein
MEPSIKTDPKLPVKPTVETEESRPGMLKILLALGPFLLVPVFSLLLLIAGPFLTTPRIPDYILNVIAAVLMVGFALGCLFALGVSVAYDFPRWTLPYWGITLVISLYLARFSGTIAGGNFKGSWLVWLPLYLAVGVGLYLRQRRRRRKSVIRPLHHDWTSFSFALYGAVPALLVFAYDEVHDKDVMLNLGMAILTAGAVLYLLSTSTRQRAVSLLGCLALAWGFAAIDVANYWGGRQEVWMNQPGDWGQTLRPMAVFGVAMLGILLLPGILSWLKAAALGLRRPGSA